MFLLLLIAPKQKNFCVTKDRVPLRGSAVRLAPALFVALSGPAGHLPRARGRPRLKGYVLALPRAGELSSKARLRGLLSAPPDGASNGKRLLLLKASSKRNRFLSLPYHSLCRHPRAYTWLSLWESWRDARKGGETERGAKRRARRSRIRNRSGGRQARRKSSLFCAVRCLEKKSPLPSARCGKGRASFAV